MNAQPINANQAEFTDELTTSTIAYPVTLLPGFICHYQDARRIQHEARRLYAISDTDLEGAGISHEGIPAHLVSMYSR